jgi:ABC-type dipeptide transport system, periplasmic component
MFLLQPGPASAARNSLTVGMVVEPEGLDPTIAAPTTIREVTWLNIYEGLVRLDENSHILPCWPRAGRLGRRPHLQLQAPAQCEIPGRNAFDSAS